MKIPKKLVVALGGNAILRHDQTGTIHEQFENSETACRSLSKAICAGAKMVITHGNGPQVGNILRRSELARSEMYPLPIDVCVADSQGGMGYMLQQVLSNQLCSQGVKKRAVTVLTRVLINPRDPSFQNPTKYIGQYFTDKKAEFFKKTQNWVMKKEGSKGWRRVVPSPKPVRIIEESTIKTLYEAGEVVIAVGGGGIPVRENRQGKLVGVEAVIDKDLASAMLAASLGADMFVVLTGVEKVCLGFDTPQAKEIDVLTVKEVKKLFKAGEFPPGNMGPKMQAALNYLSAVGKKGEVLITSSESFLDGLQGKTGTRIISNP